MMIRLHANATTTPAIRAAIQAAEGSDYKLAEDFRLTRDTIRKWRRRDTVEDASHTPHRLQTTLNEGQEELVIYLRQKLLLPLDDLLALVHEFIHPDMSRSALDRLLRRRGCSKLPKADKPDENTGTFKAYEPGYLHIDLKYLPQMVDETSRRYVFVAIDRATRWVFVGFAASKTAAAARSFLAAVRKACPFHIRTILTDNGKEFTDRPFGSRQRGESGHHEFDQLCVALGIEHRLIRPRRPQTNGMVERFNGRLEQVLQTNRFNSADDLETTLRRYVWLYNEHLPQKALGHITPLEALRRWRKSNPELFVKSIRSHPGPDS